MKVSVKGNDSLATCCSTSKTHCCTRCLGAAVHQSNTFATWHSFADCFCQFHFARRWCAKGRSVTSSVNQCSSNCRMRVTQNYCAITLHQVDVAISLYINNVCSFATSNDVRLTANRLECANRRVHSTGNDICRALIKRVV